MNEQQRELARLAARQRLSELVQTDARHMRRPLLQVLEGDPATMIVREAGSLPEDLVILGSPHRSLASWLLDTSFVQRFIVESQCPVITMKPSLEAATGTENLNDAVDAKV